MKVNIVKSKSNMIIEEICEYSCIGFKAEDGVKYHIAVIAGGWSFVTQNSFWDIPINEKVDAVESAIGDGEIHVFETEKELWAWMAE